MTKSATDVMQDIIFSAILDSILALKQASKGLPNTLLRDLNALHPNTTFADLPKELQAAIFGSVKAAFTRLLKEGYSVTSSHTVPASSRGLPRPATDRFTPSPAGRRPNRKPPVRGK